MGRCRATFTRIWTVAVKVSGMAFLVAASTGTVAHAAGDAVAGQVSGCCEMPGAVKSTSDNKAASPCTGPGNGAIARVTLTSASLGRWP